MSRFYRLVSCSNLHGTQIYFLEFPNVSFTKFILSKKEKKYTDFGRKFDEIFLRDIFTTDNFSIRLPSV